MTLGKYTGRLCGCFARLRDRLGRTRYFRGHGVHSPFVYDIVRNVFMRHELLPGERELYRTLIAEGVEPARAVQLQNLAIHCGYSTFGLDRAVGELCVITCKADQTLLSKLVADASRTGRSIAILTPAADTARGMLCRRIVGEHPSTTVDNRAYLLIFNNHLPKQHFRI